MKKLLTILSLLAAFSLAACDTDGPYEETGENVDQTIGTDLEEGGEQVDESLEETGEQIEEG